MADAAPKSPAVAAVVVAALAFATSAPLARVAVGLSPLAVAAGRTAVASIVIMIMMPRAVYGSLAKVRGKQRAALVFAGVLLAAHFAMFMGGLARTSLPAAVALVSLEPLSVVLVAWAAFGIRPTRRETAGVLVATAGALVVATGAGQGEHRLLGDAMVVGAVILFGGYVAVARGLRDAMPVMPYAAAVYAVATLALAPFAIAAAWGDTPPAATWGAVVALGLVPTLIGHTLVQSAARHLPPAVVALVSPGETIGSLAIGAFLLAAWPTRVETMGALLVVLGATIAIYGRRTG